MEFNTWKIASSILIKALLAVNVVWAAPIQEGSHPQEAQTSVYETAISRFQLSDTQKYNLYLYEKVLEKDLKIKDFFRLKNIAYCESRWRQFDANGEVLRGTKVKTDLGYMQINEKWHGKEALALGHDLYSPEGNIAYGVQLYAKEGASPWVCKGK